jgi:hypothetical protein
VGDRKSSPPVPGHTENLNEMGISAGRVLPARRLRLRLRPPSRPASDSRQPRGPHREKRCAVTPSRTVASPGALRRPSPRRPRSRSQGSALSRIGDGEGCGISRTLERSGTLRPGPAHSLACGATTQSVDPPGQQRISSTSYLPNIGSAEMSAIVSICHCDTSKRSNGSRWIIGRRATASHAAMTLANRVCHRAATAGL